MLTLFYGYLSPTFTDACAAHVILNTRPSRFSACNIEKLGGAWGRGYYNSDR